jgi:tetratricopeptide (TPR) repeat protein
MKKALFCLLWLVCLPLGAQTSHRDSVLAQARYLKSVYRTDEAAERLSALLEESAFDEAVLAELADCQFQGGDYLGAVNAYIQLSDTLPDNLLYRIRQMQSYNRLKAYPYSIRAGHGVLKRDSIPAVLSYIGDTFRQMERPDSALWYYRRSLAFKPRNEVVLSKAVNILLSAEDPDGAIAICEPFLAETPDNATIAPLMGLALYRKGDYESAIKVFERQMAAGNTTYPIHFYLGQSYWHTQVLYRAEEELCAAWQIDSSDVTLAYSIAAVKAEAYQPFEQEVKPWLDKAYEMLQPDPLVMARLHQQYGLGYFRKQNAWEQAIEHYKAAYAYNPKFISALSTIGYCYEQNKDYKQALHWYEEYLKQARPGSTGYDFVVKSVSFLKSELFMQEP